MAVIISKQGKSTYKNLTTATRLIYKPKSPEIVYDTTLKGYFGYDIDSKEWIPLGSSLGAGAWGVISGTLYNQADLWKQLSYEFLQATPSPIWVITHGLNKKPDVRVLDAEGNRLEGKVIYNTLNQLTIDYGVPLSGTAYLY
jgi:hypothetical protein